ncbi:MAG: hypothetical protein FD123_1841 [Bacteroidetes bacterium]|nr:MAG: hypothetical protein FD123_1841 [Bacteroidota bacterium]
MSNQPFLDLLNNSGIALEIFLQKIPGDSAAKTPAAGGWTVLEQLEHIFIVEKGVRNALLAPGKENAQEKTELYGDALLGKKMRGTGKWMAPDMVKPKGRFTDLPTVKKAIIEQRAFIRQKLENNEIVFDSTTFPHPIIGEMTRADWFYFMVHHTERHMRQVEEMLG